jgi:hypothetical protein
MATTTASNEIFAGAIAPQGDPPSIRSILEAAGENSSLLHYNPADIKKI